jgi:hypothetical protein
MFGSVSVISGESAAIIQVDQELSKMNRRLYRQGRYYQVKIDMEHDNTATLPKLDVFALRDDWAVQKAYQMAYSMYRQNTADERSILSKGQVSRWEDFRVASGINGTDIDAAFVDETLAAYRLNVGSFPLSNVVTTAQNERSFTWKPVPGATEYSILQEYDNAGNAQASPNSDTNDGPYADLKNEMDQQVLQNLQEDGALPPYTQNGVNAESPWVKVGTIGGTAGAQKLSTGYFTAPCGIVVVTGRGIAWNATDLLCIEAKAGDYKGVHAPSMLE